MLHTNESTPIGPAVILFEFEFFIFEVELSSLFFATM